MRPVRHSQSISCTTVTISLNYSVTIFDVASSGFDLSVSTESSSTDSKEDHYDLSHTWEITYVTANTPIYSVR